MEEEVFAKLKQDALCRNCDKRLILKIWQEHGFEVDVDWDKLDGLPNPETIRRVRQKIQNTDGRLLPTEMRVIKARRIKEEVVKRYFSNLGAWE